MDGIAGTIEEGPVPQEKGLSGEEFSAAVAAVTSAFGDPTRREIYLFARQGGGVTASQVAGRFELHPNVARHHLDKLAAGGYLEVSVERAAGAGRPSKRYRASPKDTALDLGSPRGDLLVLLLERALALLPNAEAEQMAETVGEEYGAALAAQMSPGEGQRSMRTALRTVAQALTAQGFAAHVEDRGASSAVIADHCPFGAVATQHPVVCAVDRGIVKGMLAGLCGQGIPVTISSRARGDDTCTTLV